MIIGAFGRDIEDPVRAFPLFHGATLHKHHVVAAYREVIAHAGVSTTKIRQRFAGLVCRVVGASWLFEHLKELYLVQLFARWGSKSIERYIQSAPLRTQSTFAAQVLSSLTRTQSAQREIDECRGSGTIDQRPQPRSSSLNTASSCGPRSVSRGSCSLCPEPREQEKYWRLRA